MVFYFLSEETDRFIWEDKLHPILNRHIHYHIRKLKN